MAVRRAQLWLAAGLAGGVIAAGATLMSGAGVGGLPDSAVARVNDRMISRQTWEMAANAVAADRRTPLTVEDRRHILDRLIDEELLLQHGVALGLLESDRRLRNTVVAEVMALAAASALDPDETSLRRYYEQHPEYFATPPRLRIRAQADAGAPAVPNALLPPASLRQYLGPRLTEIALQLQPGQTHREGPVAIRVLEREAPRVLPFDEVRDAVRERLKRDAEERALRELLDELRDEGRVVVSEALE